MKELKINLAYLAQTYGLNYLESAKIVKGVLVLRGERKK